MIMPGNHSSALVHYWAGKAPGSIGHLYSPPYRSRYSWMPFALDNGAFGAYKNGTKWDGDGYLKFIEHYARFSPLWVLIPDVVAAREATIERWHEWSPKVRAITDAPLAFAVQDGMSAGDVPADASVIFVGGTTIWKRRTLFDWPARFARVHVGRINTERWLWRCLEAGVESCDGTGWFLGDKKQRAGFERFLDRTHAGHSDPEHANFSLSL